MHLGGGGLARYSQGFSGFTLAEVLITLGIIGVVAAMTLPTLVQRQHEKVIVTKLKKSYSVMQQAYLMAVKDKGTPDLWGIVDNLNTDNCEVSDTNNFLYHMREYLKITKYCGGEAEGCWTNSNALNGSGFNNHEDQRRYSKAILADGANILTFVESTDCSESRGKIKDVCGFYRIDVNGNTPPNAMGRDVFTFHITKTRLIPAGTEQEGNFNTSCRDSKNHEGRGCTAWVIYNENMDYLHCNDLSWNGKTKCR